KKTSSRYQDKGKAPMAATPSQEEEAEDAMKIAQLLFGLDKMESYYVSFKEKQSIIVKSRFEIDSFMDELPDIYEQFQFRDWEPFIMPPGPYFPKLMMEFYAHDSVLTLVKLTPVRGSSHQLWRLNARSNFSLLQHVDDREFLVHGRELGGL
ncbi:hypothetical protein HAX54_044346, partial [Datura stramonium]|nr:hypothetical protein [Datura stramonium]